MLVPSASTIIPLLLSQLIHHQIDAFTIPNTHLTTFTKPTTTTTTSLFESSSSSSSSSGYVPPELSQPSKPKRSAPEPKVGDIVRYYDLDGGNTQGEELVGKITWIQSSTSNWIAEITALEDVGDGYYTEYPSRKKRKSKYYNLKDVSPLIASYVRTEDAFKIPLDKMGRPSPSFESYDLDNYQGPMSAVVNEDVVEEDLKIYGQLKGKLLKDAAIAGLIGTIIAQLVKGTDDALIYFAGAIAGIGYLFFLSIKTDTMGGPNAKYGSNVSNLRFALPLLVLVGVSVMNLGSGDTSSFGMFQSVTAEQFGAAMLGFLTYRIPLFISQLGPLVTDSAGLVLPGSAGMALQMAQEGGKNGSKTNPLTDENLTTVLLVSGPQGAGKSELVQRLIEESEGKLVSPNRVDIINEPILYEQLLDKNEVLEVDPTGRYAMTKEGILSAARKPQEGEEKDQVVVVDADVNLCKKLVTLGGTRLVGVWIGLDQVEKFESNLEKELENGGITIPENETKESVLRAKRREIVKDIEYGVVSGIFEFTVLNDDIEKSMMQLKTAADYCFK